MSEIQSTWTVTSGSQWRQSGQQRRQPSLLTTTMVQGRRKQKNVSDGERAVSIASGAVLALLGLERRDLAGLAIAGIGGALAYRGATGHCSAYQALGVDTRREDSPQQLAQTRSGKVFISTSMLINMPADELYSFWRNFENLPRFMTHLESVRTTDDRNSHWVAKAPWIYGGKVEWDAEITGDDRNSRIAWRSLPGSDIENSGSVRFLQALGDRGTNVRVEMEYKPPAGQVGRWLAKLAGEEPEQQVHADLQNFKRMMEVGEIPTISGQPRGTCSECGMITP